MDVLELFNAAEQGRNFIFTYNVGYRRQNREIDVDSLRSIIRRICEIGVSDLSYWEKTSVDFQEMKQQMEEIEEAAKERDFVLVRDKLNYELWDMIRSIHERLFETNAEELKELFWKENREALHERYPEILEELDKISAGDSCEYIRPYGLRGRVVYKRCGDMECDLYSAYNPHEIGLRAVEMTGADTYKNVYMWGCQGGFDVSGVAYLSKIKNLSIEIYVTDLVEFKQILLNTRRKGWLLNPLLTWNFHTTVEDFIQDFKLQGKEDSYIYIGECHGEERFILETFIQNNSLNSNI